jgi:hypothetical protein
MTQEYREIRLKKTQIAVATGLSETDLRQSATGSVVKTVEPGPGPKPMSTAILSPEPDTDEIAKKEGATEDSIDPPPDSVKTSNP